MPIAATAKSFVRFSTVLVAGLAIATLSGCDTSSPPALTEDARQVTVVGAGQVQGVPDTLTADFSVEFIAPDVTGAMNQANDRQRVVISALVDSGVERKDIATTNVNLQPQYTTSPDGTTSTINGYRASNSLKVTIRELDTASQVLALIVSSAGDALRLDSVSYSIDDDSQLVRDARARAFNDAKDRAQQYAQLSGLKLGKVISISEVAGGTPPTPAPMQRAMATEVALEPGQQTVSFSVTAIWELD